MAITGIGNSYNYVYENTYASQKKEEVTKTEIKETSSSQTGKTQTANSSVSDYYSYLAKKYDCVKNGNVAISGTYLKECAKNADKAKELEENLAFYKESCQSGYESAKANARAMGARVTNYSESWSIDGTGNVVMQVSVTVVSDTKGWRELKEERDERIKEKKEQEEKEEKLKEKKAAEEKAEEKRAAKRQAEKKEQTEKLADGRETKNFTVSAIGADVKSVTQSLIAVSSDTSTSTGIGFDIKA